VQNIFEGSVKILGLQVFLGWTKPEAHEFFFGQIVYCKKKVDDKACKRNMLQHCKISHSITVQ